MIDFGYLYHGTCGLARAHRAGAMAGHLGAALTAGYFYGEDRPDLEGEVYDAIERDLDRIVNGDESIWFNQQQKGITIAELFQPMPDEASDQLLIPRIANALTANIGQLRQSGHNAIFAATAIRALHDHADYATPTIVSGIEKLIATFNGAVPGRGYYGKQQGWIIGDKVKLDLDAGFPPYKDVQAMVDVVIDELIGSASMRRQGFGGLFHVINHAAALCELQRFGYKEFALKGLAAHHQHIRLWRSLPDVADELGELSPAKYPPEDPRYWKLSDPSPWSARLTHRIKTIYGFSVLKRYVQNANTIERAEKAFLYLMS